MKTGRVLVVCVCASISVCVGNSSPVAVSDIRSFPFLSVLIRKRNACLTSVRLLFACSRVFISISAPLIVVFILVCHLCKKKTESKLHFAYFSRSLSPLMYLPYYRAFPSPPSSSSPPPLLWKTVSVV